jgi:hypothetical protein
MNMQRGITCAHNIGRKCQQIVTQWQICYDSKIHENKHDRCNELTVFKWKICGIDEQASLCCILST